MMSNRKIMFAGISGVGKTTLAKDLAESLEIPFVSGSYSDLVPSTKDIPHKDMLNMSAEDIFLQDTKLINLRNKLFKNYTEFISDRSYLDSAAYLINKLAHRIPECDLEATLENCRLLLSKQCTHLVLVSYTEEMFKEWVIEDNQKRVQSKYYQLQVSKLMESLLKVWGYREYSVIHKFLHGMSYINCGELSIMGNHIKVLVLNDMNYANRMEIIQRFLSL